MKKLVLIFLALSFTAPFTRAQQTNRLDEQGRKQGQWVKYFDSGKVFYEATFVDDVPVGLFTRYYEAGGPVSRLFYISETDSARAEFFYPGGFVAARGVYVNQKKEGEWLFYSAREDGAIIARENYSNNLRDGASFKYHLTGNMAESLNYVAGKREGEWKQYFTDGTLCISSSYRNDSVNGRFETFHPGGGREIIGQYAMDSREGTWSFYNEDGTLRRTINYRHGVAENDAELIREETEYLDMLEKNGGKIADPEKGVEFFR